MPSRIVPTVTIPPMSPSKATTERSASQRSLVQDERCKSPPPKRRYHDDQDDEAYYDNRRNADDDMAKNQIRFPLGKIYGRDEELCTLEEIANDLVGSNSPSKLVWVGGPSGVGKSALVEHLRKKLTESAIPFQICEGKYNQHVSVDPFSAIARAFEILVRQERMNLRAIQKAVKNTSPESSSTASSTESSAIQGIHTKCITRLEDATRFWESEEGNIVLELFPVFSALETMCKDPHNEPETPSASKESSEETIESLLDPLAGGSTAKHDLVQVSSAIAAFLRVWSSSDQPLILYLDDLQWADVASLELLEALMLNDSIHNFLLIGNYRSNELEHCPRLQQVIDTCAEKRNPESTTAFMSLSNLPPRYISQLFMDTLEISQDEVQPITDLVYSKTLGNVFFSRQALEELSRKNALYYDVMFFHWTFSLNAADCLVEQTASKNSILSKTVVEMVQNKLKSMPKPIQRTLIVASYIRHAIDIPSLLATLKADEYPEMTAETLRKILDEAVTEGLVLKKASTVATSAIQKALRPYQDDDGDETQYRFAHDRVQEAAYSMIPPGEVRHKLLIRMAYVLLGMATLSHDPRDEWMLYVVADHFNKVPPEYVTDLVQLAKLNLRVALVCQAKASFDQAVKLLRAGIAAMYALPGVENVDRPTLMRHQRRQWELHYHLMLKLSNHLMEVEFSHGNYAECQQAVDETMRNAKTHQEKATAYHTKIKMAVQRNNKNFAIGIDQSIQILAEVGVIIPSQPKKAELLKERLRLKMALGTRSVGILADLPVALEDWKMKLLSQLNHLANLAKSNNLSTLVTLRAMRLTVEEGLTKYLPRILTSFSVPLRLSGQFGTAYIYASIASRIYERFPEERGAEYGFGQTILHSGILHLREPFLVSLDSVLSLYRLNLGVGSVEMALSAAMHFPLIYFQCGLPMNALLEPKLILFEDKSKQLHQPTYVAIFESCRQFLYNLQGKSEDPLLLRGTVMDEEETLGNMEGNAHKMTNRDFGLMRMALACIFNDDLAMEAMMLRLDEYPLFDLPLVREHWRFTFHGLAAFQLGRQKTNKHLMRTGRDIAKKLRKLSKEGSANAPPLLACLTAVEKHRLAAYDEAIAVCSSANLTHLEAMMNERCGHLQLSKGKKESAQEYLGNAMWLFNDWGAFAKVTQLREQFPFLSDYPRKEGTNSTNKSKLRKANLIGLEEPVPTDTSAGTSERKATQKTVSSRFSDLASSGTMFYVKKTTSGATSTAA